MGICFECLKTKSGSWLFGFLVYAAFGVFLGLTLSILCIPSSSPAGIFVVALFVLFRLFEWSRQIIQLQFREFIIVLNRNIPNFGIF